MRPQLSQFIRRFSLLIALGVLTSLFAACSAKPENSPYIVRKFKEVDEMKKEVASTASKTSQIHADVLILKDEVSNLRALTPDENGVIKVLQRLDEIESRLTKMEQGQAVIASSPGRTSSGAASATADEAEPAVREVIRTAPAPAVQEAPRPAAATRTQTTTTAAVSARAARTQEVAQRTVPRGKYYKFESGDTLEGIAKDNGLTVTELRAANRLPDGAKPLRGQQLFIPAK